MNTQSQWLFEAPSSLATAYPREFEAELAGFNKSEPLNTTLEAWNESTAAYLGEDGSPFPDAYRWPKQSTFKSPPAETIKTGSYQTALCPALDDFLELQNLVRDLQSQLKTRPKVPTGLRDPQAIKRWKETIEAWEKNIRAWGKQIERLTLTMIKRLQAKSYVGQGCSKLFFKNLAKNVNSLRGSWTRSGTMLSVRRTIDTRLTSLSNEAVRAAK